MFYYICNLTSEFNAKLFFETYKKIKIYLLKKDMQLLNIF